jgi:ZipA, C-terminal FtsZ-binding domain
MSTFQIALLLLGAGVLLALLGQGIWSSRRNKPRQADPLARSQAKGAVEPTLGSQGLEGEAVYASRHEPGFAPLGSAHEGEPGSQIPLDPSESASMAEHPTRRDHEVNSASHPQDMDFEVNQTLHSADRWLALDALIDAIAPIEIEGLISAQAAWAALPSTRRVGTKPFMIEGLNAQRGEWESLRKGQQYSAFQAGIQLANRLGAMNEIEFSEFVMKTQRFADAVGGEVTFTDMLEEVARGKELDAFASEHDAQLIFQIKAQRLAWSPGFVQQHAGALGFVAGVIPGRMVIPAQTPGGPPILGLSFDPQAALADDPSNSAIRLLSLTLDVPQVEQSDEPFRRMWYVAQELAQSMEGTVTDDQGYVLTSNALANIEQDLLALYNVLASRDLAAGSPQARRLFS